MAATALFGGGGGGLTRAPVLAGSARQRRATGGGGRLADSGFTRRHGVADSGPNSGNSGALGHSGTGVVGAEEVAVAVAVAVVVVVRSRYH